MSHPQYHAGRAHLCVRYAPVISKVVAVIRLAAARVQPNRLSEAGNILGSNSNASAISAAVGPIFAQSILQGFQR